MVVVENLGFVCEMWALSWPFSLRAWEVDL